MKRTRWRCQRLCQRTLIPPLWHRTCSPLCLSHFLNFIYIREDFFAERAALVQHRSASPSQGSTHPHLLHSTAQHSTVQHSTGWQRSVMRKWNALGEGDPGGVKMVTASWETDLMSSRQLHNIKKIINLYALFTNEAKREYTLQGTVQQVEVWWCTLMPTSQHILVPTWSNRLPVLNMAAAAHQRQAGWIFVRPYQFHNHGIIDRIVELAI